MANYSPDLKVGILGGGQLARMLALSAQNLGLKPHVLSLTPNDPAAKVTPFFETGSIDNLSALVKFLKKVDLATFESEFLNNEVLALAEKKSQTKIFPSVKIMGQIQDRNSQKILLDDAGIATSPWLNVESIDQLERVEEEISSSLVFKKRHFGYDGYGTYIIKNKKEFKYFKENIFEENLFIVEQYIPFKRELAIILARSKDGSITSLPLVESKQKDSRCFWIKGPAHSAKLKTLLPKLKKFLTQIKYVGVMGVEFFDTGADLMVNEIAPRVHNSGHYSMNTAGPSQFDLHWMCLLGTKLPHKILLEDGFAMVNILGGKRKKIKLPIENDSALHWYGKEENRPGRKMGHINALAGNQYQALKKALTQAKKCQL